MIEGKRKVAASSWRSCLGAWSSPTSRRPGSDRSSPRPDPCDRQAGRAIGDVPSARFRARPAHEREAPAGDPGPKGAPGGDRRGPPLSGGGSRPYACLESNPPSGGGDALGRAFGRRASGQPVRAEARRSATISRPIAAIVSKIPGLTRWPVSATRIDCMTFPAETPRSSAIARSEPPSLRGLPSGPPTRRSPAPPPEPRLPRPGPSRTLDGVRLVLDGPGKKGRPCSTRSWRVRERVFTRAISSSNHSARATISSADATPPARTTGARPRPLPPRQPRQMLPVQPLELLDVEDRALPRDAIERERLDELGARQDLPIVSRRPAEEREEVDEGIGQVPRVPIGCHRHRAVTLGELGLPAPGSAARGRTPAARLRARGRSGSAWACSRCDRRRGPRA